MVFLVVMYGYKTWTIKKAEHWRIDTFKLWCWRRLFESPLNSKEIKPVSPKGNQPWTFIGRPDAEAPILWPCDAKNQLTEKDPDPGKIEGKRRRGWQRMRWLDNIIDSMDMNLQTTGDSRGQKSLPCYHLWDGKESNTLSYWIMATHMYLWLGHKASLSSERQLELIILE